MSNPPRLPHFIIGGAPRSGTNFLCHALDRHPRLYLAKPYLPEPKVFMIRATDPAEYRARYAALFASTEPGRLLGEKTSYYLESTEACALIREHLPHVRTLFIVREPVARAYSNYLWSRKNGLETLAFDEAIRLEGQRPSPLPPEQAYARPFDYLSRGNYDSFARRYYDAFGRDAVAFFLYEEILDDPERLLEAVQKFIGVEPRPLLAHDLGIINSAREIGPPLDPALERALRARMLPAVRRFQALTGLDLRAWGYDVGRP